MTPPSEEAAAVRDAVLEEIISAFAGVSREGGISLHEAKVIDDYGADREREEARKLDTETRWEEVPDADIESHDSTLAFVDPIGWRYYLPAYMAWILRHYSVSDSFTVDSTIYSLKTSGEPGVKDHYQRRFDLLSPEQARAVCRFLRFMGRFAAEECDAAAVAEALDAYWGRFCEPGT